MKANNCPPFYKILMKVYGSIKFSTVTQSDFWTYEFFSNVIRKGFANTQGYSKTCGNISTKGTVQKHLEPSRIFFPNLRNFIHNWKGIFESKWRPSSFFLSFKIKGTWNCNYGYFQRLRNVWNYFFFLFCNVRKFFERLKRKDFRCGMDLQTRTIISERAEILLGQKVRKYLKRSKYISSKLTIYS